MILQSTETTLKHLDLVLDFAMIDMQFFEEKGI